MPYEVNLLVSLVPEYGTSDKKEKESPHAPLPHVIYPPPPSQLHSLSELPHCGAHHIIASEMEYL